MSLKRKTLLLSVIVQSVILCSAFNVRGIVAQPDELWLKAVQLATRNETLFCTKVHALTQVRSCFGKWKTTSEEWTRAVETADGGFKTEVVKRLVNGLPESESAGGATNVKGTKYTVDLAELTLPFDLYNQRKLIVERANRSALKGGQKCAVYLFRYQGGKAETIVGKAWLNKNGVPVAMRYRFDHVPKRISSAIKDLTHEVRYRFEPNGKWYPAKVMVRLKLTGRPAFFNNSLRMQYTFSAYRNPPNVELIVGGKALPAGKSTYEVPFVLIDNSLYVNVRLNDSETTYRFRVDTGAGGTVLNLRTARELGLQKVFQVQASDGYQCSTTDWYLIKKIKLGEVTVENCGAIAIDFGNFEDPSAKIDGIIGSNFLRLFTVRIDYDHKRLTFSGNTDPFREELIRSHKIGLIQDAAGLIFVPFQVAGVKTVFPAEIDTGSGGSLSAPDAFREAFQPGLNCPVVKSKGNVTGGAFDESPGMLARIGEFAIGDLCVKNCLILFSDTKLEFLLLGNPFLSQFTVVIDYPRSVMYLLPKEKQIFATNESSHGLIVKQNAKGKPFVAAIWEGSPADRSGLEIGAIILRAVANKETASSAAAVKRLMAKADLIHLVVQQGGREKVIVLRKAPLLPAT